MTDAQREKQREYSRRWREKNAEKQRECTRRWQERNPGFRERWHAKNPGKRAEYDARSRIKNLDKHRERLRAWKRKNPDKAFDLDMKKYGITSEQFHAMLIAQSGCCAICNEAFTYGQRGLNVDHDHSTGRVRGLLCAPCNLALGYFKDDIKRLEAAALYLVLS